MEENTQRSVAADKLANGDFYGIASGCAGPVAFLIFFAIVLFMLFIDFSNEHEGRALMQTSTRLLVFCAALASFFFYFMLRGIILVLLQINRNLAELADKSAEAQPPAPKD
ncbi:TPA: hypothetical protein DDW35_08890 [Candidatus Sumerlaeota bacterium]|jgi:hypothetical protein|nr:hypothetical protein [Candidatus Sumerlaeota bacterium]